MRRFMSKIWNILEAAAIGERQIQAIFAANAVTQAEQAPSEGGEE